MKSIWMIVAALAVVMVAPAQEPVVKKVERDVKVIVGGPGGPGGPMQMHGELVGGMDVMHPGAGASFAWVSAEMGFDMADVKGAPFTSDFVTETTQTLGDGNRIRNSNKSTFSRDGEGRTRRESTLSGIGPWADGKSHTTIFINDPVAKVHYILDPQTKTARKVTMPAVSKDGASTSSSTSTSTATAGAKRMEFRSENGKTTVIEHSGGPGNEIVFERRIEGPVPGGEQVPTFQRRMAGGAAGVAVADGAPQVHEMRVLKMVGDNAVTEPLGKRMIEGVEAEGTRTRLTIPAGQIGNERPLEVVSERWYSNELKTVVLSTRKDPRAGETVYKASGLRRGEPARQLFEVPSDYKIVEERIAGPIRIMHKIEEKK